MAKQRITKPQNLIIPNTIIAASASNDWKDSPYETACEIMSAVKALLKANKLPTIHWYGDPALEGSDTYGWIFSFQKMNKAQLKEKSDDMWGVESDPEGDKQAEIHEKETEVEQLKKKLSQAKRALTLAKK